MVRVQLNTMSSGAVWFGGHEVKGFQKLKGTTLTKSSFLETSQLP